MIDFKNKTLCKIRTITTFISLEKEKNTWKDKIIEASDFCDSLALDFEKHGFTVQSIRIVTNPFGEYLDTETIDSAKADLSFISKLLKQNDRGDLRIRFAIGEAKTAHEISLVPELIQAFGDLCNACVNVDLNKDGFLDNTLINHAVHAVEKISQITPRGEGNFNFTVNFNCEPLIPYFPASYHRSELKDSFVIGLETPDLLLKALETTRVSDKTHHNKYKLYQEAMSVALQFHIDAIDELVLKSTKGSRLEFAGYDSSAAPSKDCASMCALYEAMGVPYFGAAGTVEASSLLTHVFKSVTGVKLTGFSGLMLALTEDKGLAQGSIDGNFDIRSLLTYSSVCGIGLDTVPIPGDIPSDKIAALMRDTGTMAYRLNKPLTVRLFPVPGLKAGDMTVFESDDLCNCRVLAVP